MPDLLLELFSEEIPARMQAKAADDLRRLVTDGLVERGLTYAHAAAFATPRRLTLALEGLAERSPRLREERKGPRADAPRRRDRGLPARHRPHPRRARDPPRQEGRRPLRRHRPPRPPRRRDRRRDRRGGRPRLPLAEVDALGRRRRCAGSARCTRSSASSSRETGAEVVPFAIDGIAAGNTTRGHRFHAPGPLRRHLLRGLRRQARSAPTSSSTPPSAPPGSPTTPSSSPSPPASS